MKSIFRLVLIGAIGLFFPQVSPGMAADFGNAADLSVEIVLPDGPHKFVASEGKDLGDYDGPGFVEQNVLVSDHTIPLRVFFRPDRNSPRTEVVFEWGDAFKPTSSELPAYDVRILKAGAELATIHVPKQYWLTRWRWQSEPRKVIRTASDLIKAKLVPPYADLGLSAQVPVKPYSIMGTSDVMTHMGSTGERADIGLVPEVTARYLITGSKTDLESMLAWAETSGTVAWHMRDPATFSAISYAKYPKASTYGEPRGQKPEMMLNSTSPFEIDGAHMPQLTYVPFLLTGDPYYLEELEFSLTYTLGCYPDHETIIRHDQTRMFAWTLRDLFYVVKALPDNTAPWLLPKSYWAKILDKNLKWTMANYVNNPSFKTAGLQSAVDAERIAFWQEDYLATVIGAGVWIGFQDWQPVFAWKIQSNISRTNGSSGWPRSDPSFYWTEWKDKSGNPVNSWATLAALNNIPPDNDRLSPQVTVSYVVYDRAALVMATKLGISAAQPPLDWLNTQIGPRQIAWRTSLN